jgi:hypothetical protein
MTSFSWSRRTRDENDGNDGKDGKDGEGATLSSSAKRRDCPEQVRKGISDPKSLRSLTTFGMTIKLLTSSFLSFPSFPSLPVFPVLFGMDDSLVIG